MGRVQREGAPRRTGDRYQRAPAHLQAVIEMHGLDDRDRPRGVGDAHVERTRSSTPDVCDDEAPARVARYPKVGLAQRGGPPDARAATRGTALDGGNEQRHRGAIAVECG
jgi:hypothetical protein